MKRKIWYLLVLIAPFFCNQSYAQEIDSLSTGGPAVGVPAISTPVISAPVISSDPYIAGLQAIILKTGPEIAKNRLTKFEGTWASLSAEQQEQIKRINTSTTAKGMHPGKEYTRFLALVSEIKESGSDVSGFMKMIEKTLDASSKNEVLNILGQTEVLLAEKHLFSSSFHSFSLGESTITFDFIEQEDLIIEEIPIPEEEEIVEEETNAFDEWDQTDDDGWGTSDSWDDYTEDELIETDFEENNPINDLVLNDKIYIPEPSGAVVRIGTGDLTFNGKFDSLVIKNTKGVFVLKDKLFIGDGGTLDWDIAGYATGAVISSFTSYMVDVSKTRFLADDVELQFPEKIKLPVLGLFEFKSENRKLGNKRYPRFMSYENQVEVKFPDSQKIKFIGGFALEGLDISSTSKNSTLSSIHYGSGKDLFKVMSKRFHFNDSTITGPSSKITVYSGQDSIFHPAIDFKLDPYEERLTVNRKLKGFENVPYYSSFQNMDINSDVMEYDLTADSINFYNLRARDQRPTVVESIDYFNEIRFAKAKGASDYHPLNSLVSYARKINSGTFSLGEVADASRKDPKVFENAILPLRRYGYINYDPELQIIQLKRSAYHSALSQAKRKDYDEVQILSLGKSGPNATYYLESKDLRIQNISKFFLSKQLEVLVTPLNGEATVSKNRQIRFDGEINTGRYRYFGEDFRFLYDSFVVSLPKIDSIIMLVNKKVEGLDEEVEVESRITETSGTLYINKPNNKSNRKVLDRFPYFSSQTSGQVYFDDIAYKKGAYSRNVGFDLPSIDLNNVSNNDEEVTFRGTFTSNGILPDFEEDLYLLDDNTLGFEHEIPEGGYEIYGGKGRIFNKITMTKDGLVAQGPIEFLTSTLTSDKFILFEDSVISISAKVDMKPGEFNSISFPELLVESAELLWLPNADSMVFDSKKAPVKLYGGLTELDGHTTIMAAKGVFGDGTLAINGSISESDSIHFMDQRFTARNAEFAIQSPNPDKPILDGTDVFLDFRLDKELATISPENEGDAAIEFPYTQFKTSINTAEWDLKGKKIRMSKPESVDIANSYFYTTKKELDSLAFSATQAIYDIDQQKLNVKGIPYILVADSKLIPNNSSIEILADAKIEPLTEAKMLLDAENEYHKLFDGTIQIHSRTKFSGRAKYEIVNAEKDTFSIKFDEFNFKFLERAKNSKSREVDYTISEGSITEVEEIVLSSGFVYKGDVRMKSHLPALELKGSVSLDLPANTDLRRTWVKYGSQGDLKDIVLDFNNAKTISNDALTGGLHFDALGYGIYETLISDKKSPDDLDFFSPSGMMSYNPEKKAYEIQSEQRAKNKVPEGQYFNYNLANRTFEFEGQVRFFDPKQPLSIVSVSKGKGELVNQNIEVNSLLALDFTISPAIMNEIGKDMATVVEKLGLARANSDLNELTYKMTNLIGVRSAEQYRARALLNYRPLHMAFGAQVFPMVFSNVDLEWSLEQRSFYSKGKLGLSHFFDTDVNALSDGFVEIRKTLEGDELNIFYQISPQAWYFFSYRDGELEMYTASSTLNDFIDGQKKEKGEISYTTCEIENVINFAERFRKDYLGIDTPFELSMPLNLEDDEFDAFEDEEEDKDGFQ